VTADDKRAATYLSRLGVNPATTQRLVGYAESDEITLRELVAYVLSNYAPPDDVRDSEDYYAL
jgi:hypothetical protein